MVMKLGTRQTFQNQPLNIKDGYYEKSIWKIDGQRYQLNKQIDTSWVEVFSKSSYLIACMQ
jgi:hypothetical protein